jgi:PKD repeat protein
VVVAVVDSGVRYTHEDLAANMWKNSGEIPGNGVDDDRNGYIDDIYGIDARTPDSDPLDENGHGTHVAGIIGAAGNNGIGVTGVAWKVQIMACQFLDRTGDGDTSDAIACIGYARANGAQIINASWGGGEYSTALYNAIAAARDAGIIFVAAAGNDARDIDAETSYPASYDLDNMVVVCAINRNGVLDSSYSSYGAVNVDVAAPGGNIYSTWGTGDRGYTYLSGTSMATPYVSGIFALMRQRFPNETYRQLIARLLTSVDVVPSLAGKCATSGRVNLARALGPNLAADFTPSATTGDAPLTVDFSNNSFGEITGYFWNFGDGTDVVTNASPAHVYAEAGEYTATLTVVGQGQRVHTTQRTIRVTRNHEFVAEPYVWIDPAEMTPLALADNGVSAALPLGFPFSFYGQTFEHIYVAANGIAGFGTTGLNLSNNAELPASDLKNGLICPHWDNLNPTVSGSSVSYGTMGEAPRRRFVASWVNVPKNSNSARLTFQIILEEGSHEIVFNYLEVQPNGSRGAGRAATVGIQSPDGGRASQYSYNGSPHLLKNEEALRVRLKNYSYLRVAPVGLPPFRWIEGESLPTEAKFVTVKNPGTQPLSWTATNTPAWLTLEPSAGRLAVGESATLRLALSETARDLPMGSSAGELRLTNVTGQLGDAPLVVTLSREVPNPGLAILDGPATRFSGGLGGPFAPAEIEWMLVNPGNRRTEWRAEPGADWLLIEPISGSLAPGETNVLTLTLATSAAAVTAGDHTAAVDLANITAGTSFARTVTLRVRSQVQAQAQAEAGLDGGQLRLTIPAEPGQILIIEASADLETWIALGTQQAGATGLVTFSESVAEHTQHFFRFRQGE